MRVESIVWLRAPLTSRDLSTAFALGYLVHLAGDAIYGLGGGVERLQFLVWPVMLIAYPRLYEKVQTYERKIPTSLWGVSSMSESLRMVFSRGVSR